MAFIKSYFRISNRIKLNNIVNVYTAPIEMFIKMKYQT